MIPLKLVLFEMQSSMIVIESSLRTSKVVSSLKVTIDIYSICPGGKSFVSNVSVNSVVIAPDGASELQSLRFSRII